MRDVHGLNADGRVACNPRDREAAHRAQVHGIAAANFAGVTCAKCRTVMYRSLKRTSPRRPPGSPPSEA